MSRLPIHVPPAGASEEEARVVGLSELTTQPKGLDLRAEDGEKTLAAIEAEPVTRVLVPTDSQLQAKCRFWSRATTTDPAKLTVTELSNLAGTSAIRKWWYLPGFQDWFLNRDDARERILFLYIKVLDSAQTLIAEGNVNANMLLNLVKSIQLIEERLYPKVEDASLADFEHMSEEELVAFISSKGISVSQVLDVSDRAADDVGTPAKAEKKKKATK